MMFQTSQSNAIQSTSAYWTPTFVSQSRLYLRPSLRRKTHRQPENRPMRKRESEVEAQRCGGFGIRWERRWSGSEEEADVAQLDPHHAMELEPFPEEQVTGHNDCTTTKRSATLRQSLLHDRVGIETSAARVVALYQTKPPTL